MIMAERSRAEDAGGNLLTVTCHCDRNSEKKGSGCGCTLRGRGDSEAHIVDVIVRQPSQEPGGSGGSGGTLDNCGHGCGPPPRAVKRGEVGLRG